MGNVSDNNIEMTKPMVLKYSDEKMNLFSSPMILNENGDLLK